MKNKIKYIVIAGSSGGHILPAIKFINELSKVKNSNNILFVTDQVGEKFIHKISSKEVNKLQLKSHNKISYIIQCLIHLLPILFFNKRVTCLGFGGFITFPVLLLSKIFSVFFFKKNEIYIHEQNIVFGLANKFNYFISDKVFTSFPSSKINDKEIFVGNYFCDFKNNYVQKKEIPIKILLLGGSAGSLELNNVLINELLRLDSDHLEKIKLSVQLPQSHFEIYKSKYLNLSKNINFFLYDDNLIFNNFDLIISRSGSGSLNDILFETNNVYFVPHLHSRDKHQQLNLNFYKNYNMSLNELIIPNQKLPSNPFYFNNFLNPFSFNKMVCYLTR